jgi:hypothetical protein
LGVRFLQTDAKPPALRSCAFSLNKRGKPLCRWRSRVACGGGGIGVASTIQSSDTSSSSTGNISRRKQMQLQLLAKGPELPNLPNV